MPSVVRVSSNYSIKAVCNVYTLFETGADKVNRTTQAYCVKCKAKREVKDPKNVTMKNGKKALQGTCPVCGTKLFRIGG
jgi:hypothetical protein